jgi:ATP/maltotriose-dependent transcriptional regulator MalT
MGSAARAFPKLNPSQLSVLRDVFMHQQAEADRPRLEALIASYNLTKREVEVINTLINNHCNYELCAQALVLSPTTIKTHINHIFSKMQVADKAQMLVKALQLGLIELPCVQSPLNETTSGSQA